jgi:hypothetical protein
VHCKGTLGAKKKKEFPNAQECLVVFDVLHYNGYVALGSQLLFPLEDAIGSHACSIVASMRAIK